VSYPLGVDVGTTYTAAALWRDGRVQTVPLGNRANAVPSVLFLRDDGTMLVGEPAARRGIGDPDRVAREFKRRMGDDIPILVGGQGFTAQQLTGRVLRWVVERVSELQGGPPQHVVLTHPASWGEFRRNLLLQAAAGAGLRDVGLLAEPVAAATWYAAQERVEPGSLIGIYDFGGGTFDASVVRKTDTGMELYGEAGGDDSIGGIDFDHAMFRHVCVSAGVDLNEIMGDPTAASALGQLFAAVVEAKEALSADLDVVVPVVLPGISQQVLITRAELEDLIRHQVAGTVGVFGQVVRRAGVDPVKLHTVLLVGGSSRIPLVRQQLAAELGIRVAVDAHPKYTVSLGAAVAAAPRVAGLPAPSTMPPGPVRPMPSVPRTPARPPQPPVVTRPPLNPVPVVHGPPPNVQRGVRPPPPPPEQAPAVSEKVDLARTGLTGATDVRAVLAAIQPNLRALGMPPGQARGNQVMRTADRTSSRGRGRLIALLVILLIAAVVAVVVVLVLNRSGNNNSGSSGGSTGTGGATGLPTQSAAGTYELTGKLVAQPDGANDGIRAMAVLPDHDAVVVGLSKGTKPLAWIIRLTAGSVEPEYVQPQPEDSGAMVDVAAGQPGAVAVGYTGSGEKRRPAVWISADGTSWSLLGPQAEFQVNTRVTELQAITTAPDGKFLAYAKDFRSDRDNGDVSVFSSADGKNWSQAKSSGLDGSGPQNVNRVVRKKDGSYVAVGSALDGAKQGPAIWTSTDGLTWQSSPYKPEGDPNLLTMAQLEDGKLITCGTIGPAEKLTPSCWVQNAQQAWDRWDVTAAEGSPVPLLTYAVLPVSEDLLLIAGSGGSGDTADAALWAGQAK
jgi:actin-like ATPase involved in cell morphogenesis